MVKLPGLRIYDQVNDPHDLVALAPLAARWAEYRYVAAETSGEQAAQRDVPNADRRFRLSVAWSRTASDARQVMAWLMTRYSEPLEPILGPTGQRLGDVAFAAAGMSTIFLVRGNVFVRAISTGRTPASAEPLARLTDAAILRTSIPRAAPSGESGAPPGSKS